MLNHFEENNKQCILQTNKDLHYLLINNLNILIKYRILQNFKNNKCNNSQSSKINDSKDLINKMTYSKKIMKIHKIIKIF